MRQTEPFGYPRCDADRPIRAGRDETGNVPGFRQALDSLLVLGRDHGTLVRKREADRERVTVCCDHGHAPTGSRLEEAELSRSCA